MTNVDEQDARRSLRFFGDFYFFNSFKKNYHARRDDTLYDLTG